MPTLNDYSQHKTTSVLLTGVSGSGKSSLATYAPQPVAVLLFDKDSPTLSPGVDGAGVYYKPYPPAEVELDKDSYKRAKNVAQSLIEDVQIIKNHFVATARWKITSRVEQLVQDAKAEPESAPILKIKQWDGSIEEWPTPATIILEGAASVSAHMLNRVLTIHGKTNVDEFQNRYQPYDLRLQGLMDLYDMLLRLPCNKVVTTWPNDETKTEKVNGKVESVKTGIIRPSLGGKLDVDGPGKFDSSLFCYSEQGKFYVRTRNNAKFLGFKLGGTYGAQEIIDVTIKNDKPENLWNKLFTPNK